MSDLYVFAFFRIQSDPTGYYYDDWSKAIPVRVVAATQSEATQKVWDISGKAARGKTWKVRLKSVEPFAATCPCHAPATEQVYAGMHNDGDTWTRRTEPMCQKHAAEAVRESEEARGK